MPRAKPGPPPGTPPPQDGFRITLKSFGVTKPVISSNTSRRPTSYYPPNNNNEKPKPVSSSNTIIIPFETLTKSNFKIIKNYAGKENNNSITPDNLYKILFSHKELVNYFIKLRQWKASRNKREQAYIDNHYKPKNPETKKVVKSAPPEPVSKEPKTVTVYRAGWGTLEVPRNNNTRIMWGR